MSIVEFYRSMHFIKKSNASEFSALKGIANPKILRASPIGLEIKSPEVGLKNPKYKDYKFAY